jgi:hypothetical protein
MPKPQWLSWCSNPLHAPEKKDGCRWLFSEEHIEVMNALEKAHIQILEMQQEMQTGACCQKGSAMQH